MKKAYPDIVEKGRILTGQWGSSRGCSCGAFFVRCPATGTQLKILASDGEDWDHVSVSTPNRCPTWEEMCFVKDLFWDGEETVFQLHPKKSEYVNYHPYTLHLWKHQVFHVPTPPKIFVGPS